MGDHVPPDKASIIWGLVSYAEHHFSYDYMKANMTNLYIYYPETTLREKKGICIVYSVFYAVSLIGAGSADPIYLRLIQALEDTSSRPHG